MRLNAAFIVLADLFVELNAPERDRTVRRPVDKVKAHFILPKQNDNQQTVVYAFLALAFLTTLFYFAFFRGTTETPRVESVSSPVMTINIVAAKPEPVSKPIQKAVFKLKKYNT